MKINRRGVLAQIGLLVAASATTTAPSAAHAGVSNGTVAAPADAMGQLHDALLWDNHSGFDPKPDFNLERLTDWRTAGVDFLSIDVCYDVIDWQLAIRNLGAYITWLEKHADSFLLVRRADDVLEAKRTGRMAITFDLEGMNALNGDPALVSLYYRLGVRQMLTAYNKNNLAGGGCHDKDIGLTPFGRRVIAEMNRVGMLVDCSHTGHRTTMDIMEAATQPVIFSHSNPKALRSHGRNITDDQIRACAKTGGLDYTPVDPTGAVEESLDAHPDFWPPADYAAPWPMKDAGPDSFRQVAMLLVERGWSGADVRKVLGENFLRVARAVWK